MDPPAPALREARAFGCAVRAALSIVLETILSALFAPIRMIFHTEFVVAGIAGLRLHWKSPPRADAPTDWPRALRRHGVHTLIGLAWTALVWRMDPRVLPWILPVAGALILSSPLSVLSSRVSLGRLARRAGLFATPEETAPPREITRTVELTAGAPERPGLVEAVVDPLANALACAQGTPRTHGPASARAARDALVALALVQGLDALDKAARGRLLHDPLALSALHSAVWTSPEAHASWHRHRESTGPSNRAPETLLAALPT